MEQTQLARRRLWLGITNVGVWVLAACAGLCWLVAGGTHRQSWPWYLFAAFCVILVQACFDFVGGVGLMPTPRPTAGQFFPVWLRGATSHTAVLASVGLLSYGSFVFTGGFCLAVLLATIGLIFTRPLLLRLVAGVSSNATTRDGEDLLLAHAADPAFTGGIIGFGYRATSLLPTRWMRNLPAAEFAAETSRRSWQISKGLPFRALAFVLSWNLLGAFLGPLLFRFAGDAPVEALFGYACWMTLWGFGSLLVLPSLSRSAVFAADRAAANAGHDPRGWIVHFPEIIGEDGGANAAIQTIFYPIPSAPRRLLRLETAHGGSFVPGNLARSNLYYSWATFTLLGRAVHCNVGRPALWVFPPSA